MGRGLCLFLSIIIICSPALAGNPEKKARLKEGAVIYAFSPVAWTFAQSDRNWLPADKMDCTGTNCVYIVPACEPLYVTSQIKDRTWVLPGDERTRKLFMQRERLMGITVPLDAPTALNVSVSGGWSTKDGFEPNWSHSGEDCMAKIQKSAAKESAARPPGPQSSEKPQDR